MTTARPAFTKYKLTGAPSWYRLDYPDNIDALFPLVGYITNDLPDPHSEWVKDYQKFEKKLAKKNEPRLPLSVRIQQMTVGQAVRLLVVSFLVLSLFSAGTGFAVASFAVVPETAVSVPADGSLKMRSQGFYDVEPLGECFERIDFATGYWVPVCY